MALPSLGTFPGRALLTGAGFTKNWGGHLAAEIWPLLASTGAVRGSSALRRLFRETMGFFEDALAKARIATLKGEVTNAEIAALEKGIIDVFIEQERTINGNYIGGTLNDRNVEEMLSLFGKGPRNAGNRFAGLDSGYIFTLNQDLLVERVTVNRHMFDQPVTPGVAPLTDQQRLGRNNFRPTNERHLLETRRDRSNAPLTLAGNLNYVKLHGSYEWRSDDGRNVLVVGGSKEETIREFAVLGTYLELFGAVCSTRDLRLMVIGYGFADEHINKVIADGARNNGLTVFLVDPRPPQQTDRLLRAKNDDGIAIADAIGGWSTKPLAETFPPPKGTHRSPEYRRILQEFFAWTVPP